MDAQAIIHQTVNSHSVVLYMKGTPQLPQCGFSSMAVKILEALGAEYIAIDVLADEAVRQGIKQYANWPTIPQLYVQGEFVVALTSCVNCMRMASWVCCCKKRHHLILSRRRWNFG